MWVRLLAALSLVQPLTPTETSYATMIANHVNQAFGTEHLVGSGGEPLTPGLFLVLGRDRLDIYDKPAFLVRLGWPVDDHDDPACQSGCSSAFYRRLQRVWMELAVDAASFASDVPGHVQIVAHEDVYARAAIELAYAAAETRPIAPPYLTLVVNAAGRGLRGQDVFLVPPKGLSRPGSAALGLTVTFVDAGYRVTGADRSLDEPPIVNGLDQLKQLVWAVKRRHPGKNAVIVVPDDDATIRDLLEVIVELRPMFGHVVLSLGQKLSL